MRAALLAIVVVAAATAAEPATALERASAARGCTGRVEPLGTPAVAYAAVVRRRALAFRRPGAEPFAEFQWVSGVGCRVSEPGPTHV